MTEAVQIRPERPTDQAGIAALTHRAFLDVAHSDQSEPEIVARLRQAGALTLSLVAEIDDELIGHLALSPVLISDGTPGWYGLGPISVVPEHQRRGVGSGLMREGLAALRASGAAGCVVLGEPAFYGRFGFRSEAALTLAGVPPAYFQALPFRPPLPQGEVSYHKAFSVDA